MCVFRQLRRDGISTNGISCVELNCCSCSSPGERAYRLFIRAISWWCFDLFVSNLSVCWASPQQFIKAAVLRCALGRECLDHRKYILVVCVCVCFSSWVPALSHVINTRDGRPTLESRIAGRKSGRVCNTHTNIAASKQNPKRFLSSLALSHLTLSS